MNPEKNPWVALPHGDFRQLAENIWIISGDLPRGPLGRHMVVVRLEGGGLLLHNPIALVEASMADLEGLGAISIIYVPGAMHRIDCGRYEARFPEARVVCPPAAAKSVAKVARRVEGLGLPAAFGAGVSVIELAGTGGGEGVLRIESPDGVTLVFNDALFNLPHQPGLGGLLMKWLGSTGGPKVTRLARMLVLKDKAALRAQLEELARDPALQRLIPGHGDFVEANAGQVLASVASTL